MASRILHYLVGDRVAKQMGIKDYKRFMTGNLYPDCVSGGGGRSGKKGIAHFVDNRPDLTEKWEDDVEVAAERFCRKYNEYVCQDELYLGYVCHLLTDMVWHDEVYVKLKRKCSSVKFSELSQPLYRDYHRLNEILRLENDISYTHLEMIPCDIEEIELELWENFEKELAMDFEERQGAKKEDLEILKYEWIQKFIEDSIKICCDCENFKNNT